MASGNGETFKEIREILSTEKTIPTKVGMRLILAGLADLRDRVDSYENRMKEVEKNSIIRWVKENKAMALILASLIVTGPADTLWNILKMVFTQMK